MTELLATMNEILENSHPMIRASHLAGGLYRELNSPGIGATLLHSCQDEKDVLTRGR